MGNILSILSKRPGFALLLAAFACAGWLSAARAADHYYWNALTGEWEDEANWNIGAPTGPAATVPPANYDSAYIGNGGTATIGAGVDGITVFGTLEGTLLLNGSSIAGSRMDGSTVTLGIADGTDMQITGLTLVNATNKDVTWTGGMIGEWDIATENWEESSSFTSTTFLDGDIVRFSGNVQDTVVTVDGERRVAGDMYVGLMGGGGLTINGSIVADGASYDDGIGGTATGKLYKSGMNTLTLKGDNRFVGGVELAGGLSLGHDRALGVWTAGDPDVSREGMLLVNDIATLSLAFDAGDAVKTRTITNHIQVGTGEGTFGRLDIVVGDGETLVIAGVVNANTNTGYGSPGVGGAVSVTNGGLTINDGVFPPVGHLVAEGNTSAVGGGAFGNFLDTTISFLDFSRLASITLTGNSSLKTDILGPVELGYGGALVSYSNASNSDVIFGDNATLTGNIAGTDGDGMGGAIVSFSQDAVSYVTFGANATLTGNIAGAEGDGGGGAIYSSGYTGSMVRFGAGATLTGNIAGNGGYGGGGAILSASTDGQSIVHLFSNTLFANNRAGGENALADSFGGAIYSSAGNVNVSGNTLFKDNIAVGNTTGSDVLGGGAIYLGSDSSIPSMLFLDTTDGHIAFTGNKANVAVDGDGNISGGVANSVTLEGNARLDIFGDGNVYFDDPIASGAYGRNTLTKNGAGFVQFVGDNRLDTTDNSDFFTVNVVGGAFRVVNDGINESFDASGAAVIDGVFIVDFGATLAGSGKITSPADGFIIGGTLAPDGWRYLVPDFDTTTNTFAATNERTGTAEGTLILEGDVEFVNATLENIHLDGDNAPIVITGEVSGTISTIDLLNVSIGMHKILAGDSGSYTSVPATVTRQGEDAGAGGRVTYVIEEDSGASGDLFITFNFANQALTWTGEADAVWNYGAAANWKDDADAASAFIDGDSVAFDSSDTASNRTITLDSAVVVADMTVSGSGDYAITGAGGITGSGESADTTLADAAGKLVKTDNSSLSFTNTGGNTFNGGIEIHGGKIWFTRADQLGDGGKGIAFRDDAQLIPNADGITLANNISISAGANAEINTNGNTLTLSGILSGEGDLQKTGLGTLTLTGVNNHTGGMHVSNGTVALSGSGSIANSSVVSMTTGATFDISAVTGAETTVKTLRGDGGTVVLGDKRLVVETAGSTTYAGAITGAGGLTMSGAGTLTLTGASTYSGGTLFTNGTLAAGSGTALGAGALTFDGGEALVFDSPMTLANDIVLNQTGTVRVEGITTLSGVVSGTAGLTKTGFSTLILTGSSAYTGATTVSSGTLALSGSGSIAASSGVTVESGAIFSILYTTAGATVRALSGGGDVYLGERTLTIDGTESTTFSGSISGDGGLVKAGTSTVILTGVSSYGGGTTLQGGTLTAGRTGTLGGGTLTFNDAAPLDADKPTLRLDGGVYLPNNVTLTTAGTVDVAAAGTSAYLYGDIAGGGAFTKTGAGNLTLQGANAYTGTTTIAAGSVTFDNSDGGQEVHNLNGSGAAVANSGKTVTLMGTSTFDGAFDGAGVFKKDGAGTTTTLTKNVASANTTSFTVANGTLALGGAALVTLTTQGSLAVESGGTLAMKYNDASAGAATVTANAVAIGGKLVVDGFAGDIAYGTEYVLISAAGDITGAGGGDVDFTSVEFRNSTINNPAEVPDYLTAGAAYARDDKTRIVVTAGLMWYDRVVNGLGEYTQAHGSFTIDTDKEDAVGDVLADRAGTFLAGTNASGGTPWDGETLTKKGAGKLTLTGANTYSGGTLLHEGTLAAGHNSALGTGTLEFTGFATLELLNGVTLSNNVSLADYATVKVAGGVSGGLSGVVSGTMTTALTKTGGGTLTLSGANTYDGGTDLRDGALEVTNAGALGSGVLTFVNDADAVSSPTLKLGATIGNAIMLTRAGTVEVAAGTEYSLTGTISGSRDLSKTGGGDLILAGTNDYTGGTVLKAGKIVAGNADALGTGTFIFDGGTELRFTDSASFDMAMNLDQHGALSVDAGKTVEWSGEIAGAGRLTKNGAGALELSAANTYAETTMIAAGVLALKGGGSIAASLGVSLNDNATFDISGVTAGVGATVGDLNSTGTGTGALVRLGAETLTVNGGVYAGTIGGAGDTGGLTKALTGTLLQLSGVNAYTGATHVETGTLALVGSGSIAASSGLTIQPGATFDISATTAGAEVRALSGYGEVALGGQILTVGAAGTDTVYYGDIGGNGGSLVKTGTGTLELNGQNTYSGATTLAGGKLAVVGDAPLGTGALVFDGGDALVLNFPGVTLANDITLTQSGTVESKTGSEDELAGDIDGAGGLTVTGGGTLKLSGTNTYTGGTAFEAGTLVAMRDTALGAGALDFDGGDILTIADGVTLANNVTLTQDGTVDVGGGEAGLSGVIAGAGLTIKWGTLTLSGNNTYDGGTTLSGGTLKADHDRALGTGALDFAGADTVLLVTDGRTLANDLTLTNAGTVRVDAGASATLSGDIGGTNTGLTKTGDGTLTLSGTNAYTGATIITSGTLAFDTNQIVYGLNGDATATALAGRTVTLSGEAVFDGTLNGPGTFEKTGAGTTLELTAGDIQAGSANLHVKEGTVSLPHGALTTTGDLTVDAGASVNVAFNTDGASLTAGGIDFAAGGTLVVTGFYGAIERDTEYTLLRASSAIGIDLGSIDIGIHDSGFDYLTLDLGYGDNGADNTRVVASGGLAWYDQSKSGTVYTEAHGTFTIHGGESASIGNDLADRTPLPGESFLSGWDGRTLTKKGDGALTLIGANTYTGGTVVEDGRLVGDTISLQGDIDNSGVVEFDQSTTGAYAGDMTGDGSLEKTGGGTLVITGANTHTGGTAVSDGTLQIGDGGAAGSIAGDIRNDSAVVFNRSDAVIYGGNISGDGRLEKTGDGTLALTGANTHTGGTTVSGGLLQIGGGGTSGSIAGDIVNNTGVVFNRSDAIAYGDVISGGGGVAQAGTGVLTLSGENTYSGGTEIAEGTLRISSLSNIGSGGLAINYGGALRTTADIDFSGRTISVTGAGAIDAGANAFTLGNTAGTGLLTKTGSGRLDIATGSAVGNLAVADGTLGITGGEIGSVDIGSLNGGTLSGADLAVRVSGASDSDRFAIGAALDFAGGNSIDIASGADGLVDGGVYAIFTAAGMTLSGTDTVFTHNGESLTVREKAKLTRDGDDLKLHTYSGINLALTWNGSGAGVWDTAASNWTSAEGATEFIDNDIVTFGPSGAKNVAVAGGGVTVAGMTVSSNGYTFTGGSITGSTVVNNSDLAATGALAVVGSGVTAAFGNDIDFAGGIDIEAGNRVVFDYDDSRLWTNDNAITGGGAVEKAGDGKLTLSGQVDATVTAVVTGGTLYAETDLGAASVESGALHVGAGRSVANASVESGAALTGSGTVGAASLDAGAIVSPGDGEGDLSTLTFAGDTRFDGTELRMDLGADNASDRIQVNGVADFTGGGNTLNLTDWANGAFTVVAAASVAGDADDFAVRYKGGELIEGGRREATLTITGTGVSVTAFARNLNLAWSGDGVANAWNNDENSTLWNGECFIDGDAVAFAASGSKNPAIAVDPIYGVTVADMEVTAGGYTFTGGKILGDASGSSLTGRKGKLTLNGAGTTTFENELDFAGGVEIGTGHTLAFDYGRYVENANAVDGDGALTKSGAGELVLSGTNTYSGATTVASGALSGNIASGTDLEVATGAAYKANGSDRIVGTLTGGGSVVMDGNDLSVADGDFSGVISGDGAALTKTSSGELVLSGANTHTGGTTVAGGTLIAENASALGSGGVAVNGGAALVLDFKGTLAAGNVLSGAGGLNVTGDVAVDHANAGFTGKTDVVGTLILGHVEALPTSAVAVSGTLKTSTASTVKSLSSTGGAVDLTAADLTVSGAAVLDGATLTVALSYDGTTAGGTRLLADTVEITGGTLSLDLSKVPESAMTPGQPVTFSVVESASGLTGQFGAVRAPNSLFTATQNRDEKNLYVDLRFVDNPFTRYASNRNTGSAADALNWITNNDPSFISDVWSKLSDEQIAEFVDRTRGTEIIANGLMTSLWQPWRKAWRRLGANHSSTRRPRIAAANGAAAADALASFTATRGFDPNRIWAEGTYQYTDVVSDGNSRSYDIRRSGLALGYDHAFSEALQLGGMFAYNDNRLKANAGSRVDAGDFTFALYASYAPLAWLRADGFVGYGMQDYESKRRDFSGGYRGDYNGESFYAALQLSAPFKISRSFELGPVLGFDYQKAWMDAHREKGTGSFAQRIGKSDHDVLTLRIGLAADWFVAERVRLNARASYGRDVNGGGRSSVTSWFAGSPGAPAMVFQGVRTGRDRLDLGVGFEAFVDRAKRVSVYGEYDFTYTRRSRSHYGRFGVALSW